MTKDEAIAFLERDGNLKVPCSRYGLDTATCAPVAYALAEIAEEANGDEITEDSLEFYMGLVVNNHDDVLSLIKEHGTQEHRELIEDALHADEIEDAERFGREAGTAAGSWVIDGNTSTETAARILKGIDEGDPQILDMMPSPLSGEWAGESITELSDRYGIDLMDDEVADAFEAAYSDGYWAEVERAVRYQTTDEAQ